VQDKQGARAKAQSKTFLVKTTLRADIHTSFYGAGNSLRRLENTFNLWVTPNTCPYLS
jgi:hypothetical protein